jgi:hypothetical protein
MAWVVIIFLDLHSEHRKSHLNLLDLQMKTSSIKYFLLCRTEYGAADMESSGKDVLPL